MKDIRKLTLLANLLAIAIVLNIIESAIPIIPVPGAKLGFANVVTIIVLYGYSFKDSFTLTLMRVLAVALLAGRIFQPAFFMSLSGAFVSTLVMGLIKKTNFFGMIGVSVIGSITHAIGQVVAGVFVIGSVVVLLYLPIMLFLSVPAGALTGIIAQRFYTLWRSWQKEVA